MFGLPVDIHQKIPHFAQDVQVHAVPVDPGAAASFHADFPLDGDKILVIQ